MKILLVQNISVYCEDRSTFLVIILSYLNNTNFLVHYGSTHHENIFFIYVLIEKQLYIWSLIVKVSDPFVETLCIFQCIKNIINAEMWA